MSFKTENDYTRGEKKYKPSCTLIMTLTTGLSVTGIKDWKKAQNLRRNGTTEHNKDV